MKKLLTFLFLSGLLMAGITTSYERDNDDAGRLVPEMFSGVSSISLSPTENESKALYQLSHNANTVMSLCYSTTLESIKQHGSADKLSKYLLVTPVLKGELHLIVPANSRFKTIHDLERHNVSMGLEGTATHLTAQSIFVDANIAVSEFHYDLNEAMRRLIGGGLDAVVALGKSPIAVLDNYKGQFKLVSVPSTGSHASATIQGSQYGLSRNVMTMATDLILIAKKDAVSQYSLNTLLSKVTRNLLHGNGTDINSICSGNGNYGLMVSPTLGSSCTQYQNEASSSGKGQVLVSLDLLRQANSIDDVEIYSDALRQNKAIGGLSSDTEIAKLKQVYGFYKNSQGAKLMIKSYVNSGESDAYNNAQQIFKQLRKMGIGRSDMIIKSFNESTFCKDTQKPHCGFLNRKITFEFIE
ncbi:MAG: hypothetical protein KU29_09880 [Sulfurovum sp. FS06-10]|nr:MAG: hypothetical protein KU29_09880 [Sulfurovum sp. FS06-10]